jgi:hypothetical protein
MLRKTLWSLIDLKATPGFCHGCCHLRERQGSKLA